MEKYIRTKDGKIFGLESKEVSSWEYIDNDTAINEYGVEGAFYTIYYFDENKGHYSEYDGKGGHSCDFIEEKDILKQSDNLAELIDKYVGISNNKPMLITYEFGEYYDEYDDSYTKEELLAEYDVIYGAIWTDKGLIYVAKMDMESWCFYENY